MKPEAPVEREVRVVPPRSPSPQPRRRGLSRHDDDDEWVESSPRKRSRARAPSPPSVPTTPPAPSAPPAPAAPLAPAAPPAPAPPPPTPPAPAPPAAPPAPDERRRAASTHSRLLLLYKHKEMLKKDIIKKRGLLEKELGVEIQVGFRTLSNVRSVDDCKVLHYNFTVHTSTIAYELHKKPPEAGTFRPRSD